MPCGRNTKALCFAAEFYGIVGEFVGKRLILLLVTVIIGTLPLFGCNAELSDLSDNLSSAISDVASADAETEPHTIVLPYDGNDSLNPFTVKTVANSALMQVLYDGLIRLNEKYEPEPVAAQEVKLNGLQCTVVLRNNLQFANGNAVTARMLFILVIKHAALRGSVRDLLILHPYRVIKYGGISAQNRRSFICQSFGFPDR